MNYTLEQLQPGILELFGRHGIEVESQPPPPKSRLKVVIEDPPQDLDGWVHLAIRLVIDRIDILILTRCSFGRTSPWAGQDWRNVSSHMIERLHILDTKVFFEDDTSYADDIAECAPSVDFYVGSSLDPFYNSLFPLSDDYLRQVEVDFIGCTYHGNRLVVGRNGMGDYNTRIAPGAAMWTIGSGFLHRNTPFSDDRPFPGVVRCIPSNVAGTIRYNRESVADLIPDPEQQGFFYDLAVNDPEIRPYWDLALLHGGHESVTFAPYRDNVLVATRIDPTKLHEELARRIRSSS